MCTFQGFFWKWGIWSTENCPWHILEKFSHCFITDLYSHKGTLRNYSMVTNYTHFSTLICVLFQCIVKVKTVFKQHYSMILCVCIFMEISSGLWSKYWHIVFIFSFQYLFSFWVNITNFIIKEKGISFTLKRIATPNT